MVNIIKEKLPIKELLRKKLNLMKRFLFYIANFIIGMIDDKYIGVVKNFYEDNILDDDMEDLDLSNEKDDFEKIGHLLNYLVLILALLIVFKPSAI